jgi:hypothetical protein
VNLTTDVDIRPWLNGFVEEVGERKARILLANAGNFTRLMVE